MTPPDRALLLLGLAGALRYSEYVLAAVARARVDDANIGLWHLADIYFAPANVRFGGKADMALRFL